MHSLRLLFSGALIFSLVSYAMEDQHQQEPSLPFTLAVFKAPTAFKDPQHKLFTQVIMDFPDILFFQNKNNRKLEEIFDATLKNYGYGGDGIKNLRSLCKIGIAYKYTSFTPLGAKDSTSDIILPGRYVLTHLQQVSNQKLINLANILYTSKNIEENYIVNSKILTIFSEKPADIVVISGNFDIFSEFDKDKLIKLFEEAGYRKKVISKKLNPLFIKS